jgi:hypothetical protein
MKNTPDKDHIYGLYDPEGCGPTFYATEKERDEAAKEAIQGYLDDTWRDEVEGVVAFTVTAKATQVDVKHPEGELDEDRCDENGDYWGSGIDFSCNYALRPVTTQPTATKKRPRGTAWRVRWWRAALGAIRFTWKHRLLCVVIAND